MVEALHQDVGAQPARLDYGMNSRSQRTAPTEEGRATFDYSAQALVQNQQQSEDSLNKEDISPGARELVQQYFGSLGPERSRAARPSAP
jgi:hypothetical protein